MELRETLNKDVKEKLKLGAAVYAEAESIDKVRFVDDLTYQADTLDVSDEVKHRYHQLEIYPYYDLEQLRNLGLTNFGCDFAALTGRADGDFDSFCGVVKLEVHVGKTEKICDRVHPEELMTRLENASEPICIIDEIEYGNFIILLAEANCSHNNIFTYVTQKLLREDPSEYYYYKDYYTPEITFHLITLDDNGYVLQPNKLYLANTYEQIGSSKFVTPLIGRSSVGRLGLFLQITAPLGHVGTNHKWTLELNVVQPLKIYPLMKIGQVTFWRTKGRKTLTYCMGEYKKYQTPQISKFYKEL